MKFSILTTACLVCAVFCAAEPAAAQQTRDIVFRQPLRSARSIGIGEADAADLRSVANAAWNPAALSFLELVSADAVLMGKTDGRHMQGGVSAPLVVNNLLGFAVGVRSAAFDAVDWERKTGMLYAAGVSGAVRLTPAIGIGAVYNFQNARLGGTSVNSHGAGIGVVYSVLPALSYGLTVMGIGSGIVYRQNDSVRTIETEKAMPRSITFGGAWHYPTTHGRVIVNYFIAGQKTIGVEDVVYRMGLEVLPWKFLAIRGGVVSGPVTAVGRFGIGIRTPIAEVDYAVVSSTAEVRMHSVSVSFPIVAP